MTTLAPLLAAGSLLCLALACRVVPRWLERRRVIQRLRDECRAVAVGYRDFDARR